MCLLEMHECIFMCHYITIYSEGFGGHLFFYSFFMISGRFYYLFWG